MRWSTKNSALLIVLVAFIWLKPCFFKNKFNTALASSFSATSRNEGTTLTLNDPPVIAADISTSENMIGLEKPKTVRINHMGRGEKKRTDSVPYLARQMEIL